MLYNIKNLFVALSSETESPDAPCAVAYGLSLAGQAGARLTVQSFAQKLSLPHSRTSDVVAGMAAAENERLLAIASKLADDARAAAALAGVPCRTDVGLAPHSELVANFLAEARVHDLTILDAESNTISTDRAIIEAAVFQSGRPVLIVPQGYETFKAERVVVAWDGSARAARALNDALPILRAAKSVEIVSIVGEKDLSDSVPGAELAPHLASHEINFEITSLPAVHGDAGETLRIHAMGTGADLIVMGAYVHSWFRQVALGGVTQSLLRTSPAPLFLSY
ncbi:universal stress protein [Azorhizobium doebereinerae]|uniref:universal stress protein n=1 Tax=Azorhizobium doebereinerae TaxID=281091 RepID=UPI00040B4AB2|nr:universal stress protein [Azorhizobium doebereinerae]